MIRLSHSLDIMVSTYYIMYLIFGHIPLTDLAWRTSRPRKNANHFSLSRGSIISLLLTSSLQYPNLLQILLLLGNRIGYTLTAHLSKPILLPKPIMCLWHDWKIKDLWKYSLWNRLDNTVRCVSNVRIGKDS